MSMKKILLASSALALAATPVLAGGYVEPRVEPMIAPEVIVADTASSSAGIIVPLLLLVLIAAAIASRSGGGNAIVAVAP